MKPSPISVVLVLAAACMLAATRPNPNHARIDRGFLAPLSAMPVDRSLTEREESLYGGLVWENEHELRYLARTGDPLAVGCVVRIIARGGAPGGCSCCSGAFEGCVLESGASPAFWRTLDSLPRAAQLRVLRSADRIGYGEADAASTWEDDRERFLSPRPELRAAYLRAAAAEPGE